MINPALFVDIPRRNNFIRLMRWRQSWRERFGRFPSKFNPGVKHAKNNIK